MSLEWERDTSRSIGDTTEKVELEISKSTLRTAERKAGAYSYKSKERVLEEAIGIGINKVI